MLYDTAMIKTMHYVFFQIHRIYNTKSVLSRCPLSNCDVMKWVIISDNCTTPEWDIDNEEGLCMCQDGTCTGNLYTFNFLGNLNLKNTVYKMTDYILSLNLLFLTILSLCGCLF